MRTPDIKSIDTVLQIYYSYSEIGNPEIKQLFNSISKATICKLKKEVRDEMISRGIYSHRQYTVNTEIAFEVWGLDIKDLEKRKNKIKNLSLQDHRIAS